MVAARHGQTRQVCAALASNCFAQTSRHRTLCRHGACLPCDSGCGSIPVPGVGARPVRVPRECQCAACLRGTRFAVGEGVGAPSKWTVGIPSYPRPSDIRSPQCVQAMAPHNCPAAAEVGTETTSSKESEPCAAVNDSP